MTTPKNRKKRRKNSMLIPTIIMALVAATFFLIAHHKGDNSHIAGLSAGMKTLFEILPLLLFAFAVAGLMQVVIPKEIIARWLGTSSGIKGILVGSAAGALIPGGPYVVFPLAAGFLKAGASMPTMVAFVTSWGLWSLNRIPMTVAFLGWRFTLAALATTVFFPPLAGILTKTFFQNFLK